MTRHRVITPFADVHGAPDLNALRGKYETQLVFGEEFLVESEENGWCKGTCAHDGYKGHVLKTCLELPGAAPTHIVTAGRTHSYREASIKSPPVEMYSFGSRVTLAKQGEKFGELADGGWVYLPHLAPVGKKDDNYMALAQNLLETPYYWGGRSGFGIDCSGLVQVVLARAGIDVPRDTEQQQDAIGETVEVARTGDIVFFKGHVGIMIDADNLLHANAHHMKTVIEPLWTVSDRSGGVTVIKRI